MESGVKTSPDVIQEEKNMSVRRVYVEKKPEYAIKARELKNELENYLGISTVTGVRVLIRYDVENISDRDL